MISQTLHQKQAKSTDTHTHTHHHFQGCFRFPEVAPPSPGPCGTAFPSRPFCRRETLAHPEKVGRLRWQENHQKGDMLKGFIMKKSAACWKHSQPITKWPHQQQRKKTDLFFCIGEKPRPRYPSENPKRSQHRLPHGGFSSSKSYRRSVLTHKMTPGPIRLKRTRKRRCLTWSSSKIAPSEVFRSVFYLAPKYRVPKKPSWAVVKILSYFGCDNSSLRVGLRFAYVFQGFAYETCFQVVCHLRRAYGR